MSTSYLEALRQRLLCLLEEAIEDRCTLPEAVHFIEDEVRASYHRGCEAGRRNKESAGITAPALSETVGK